MHALLSPFVAIFSALKSFCSTLSAQFDQLVGHSLGTFGIAAVVVTSLVLAVACATWAIAERARRSTYRERVQAVLRRAQVARRFRDSILDSLPETVVVLRSRARQPLSFGGGSRLLQHCLDGPDATPLATAIDDLLRHASGFSLSVRMSGLRQVFVRGLRIGTGAALFLRAQERVAAKAPAQASRDGEIVIGVDGRLQRHNQAFARQWSLSDDELRGAPLWAEIVERCIARNGRDTIWDIVSYAASTAAPERLNDWGTVIRGSGTRISVSAVRLNDGATRVTFAEAALPPDTQFTGPTVMAA
jgi:PAS domain-containing protein